MGCCKHCKKVTSVLRNDGINFYCRDCYGKKAIVRCGVCNEIITSGVEHRDNYYHSKCFTCTSCRKCLAKEQFFFRDNARFCCQCYEKHFCEKCARCEHAVTGIGDIFYIFYDNRPWHPECFTCTVCETSLLGGLTVTLKGHIYCTKCASSLLPQ